ncbi:MAG: ferredoxin--NADP reductase [Bacteroidetes bacterium]|nr:ferredoxin--NADP reductase [Bacteroidota bacterium]
MKFVPLKLRQLVHETDDAYTLQFEKPAGSEFDYLPGQYLTLKVNYQGESLRRAFSLSSNPRQDDFLAVTIKAVPDGRVSNFLRQALKAGDTVEVYPPMGKFVVETNPQQSLHYVLVGGGSGITPMYSILRSVLREEPLSQVTLVYANRHQDSIIFKEQLQELEAGYAGRLQVVHVLDSPKPGWEGLTGMLTQPLAVDILTQVTRGSQLPAAYYMCGPGPMMDSVDAALRHMGVAENRIFREYYSAPLPDTDSPEEEIDYELRDRTIVVELDGKRTNVPVKAGKNILDAAVNAGLDPPYACQEGICSTCRAKVHSGLVQMVEREGLSDEELEAGYVLTCQCYPLTDDVVLEYC